MQRRFRVLGWIVVGAVFVFCSYGVSLAGDRDHTGGFFLRLSAGGGAASTKIEDASDDLKLSGEAGELNFAIGGMIAPNLALHGTLFGWAIADPDVELNDLEGTLDGDLALGAVGAGLTYYFMPANLYISGSVGGGQLSFDAGNVTVESDPGLVVDITVGKEWWVGKNWGIGVAAGIGLHSIPDKNADENWSGTSFAVRFTATMN